MEKQTILFDLDDTLIYCNKYFISTIDRFAQMMKEWFYDHGLSLRDVKQKQLELDLAGVQTYGFVKERFPKSLVETYDYYAKRTGRHRTQEEVERLMKLGNSVYEQAFEPLPFMEKTLKELASRGHELCLYTGGDESVQRSKVRQLKLERFFDNRIFVTPHKTSEVLDRMITHKAWDRKRTWMIGNSPRTDIVPALKAGIHCIYIPAEKEWEYNKVEVDVEPKGAFFTVNSLKEIPAAISRYVKSSDK